MFDKILIANRGEIAVRVVRTCQELGVPTVAVYSSRDEQSSAVRLANESVRIGPPQAKHSYLNAMAVVEAAMRTGADAIHPGYGFLSEDPDFADVCAANGITMIGPPADVMAVLGGKITARALMRDAGLPLLPGGTDALDADAAAELAGRIGFPVIVKASAGGGGRGMSVVRDAESFPAAYARTEATAQVLFGDHRVYVERYLDSARHVEVQVLCDGHGNAVHLGTRDCTVQRRHQKLLEESPAPDLPAGLADRMGRAALDGALAAGYVGAGTFEFLVAPDGEFYFMEVNCRIQVEHPVTEMVTGIDLVAEQIRVASGEPLRLRQEDVRQDGVSIECRINAEDPDRDFLPTPGPVAEFVPAGGPGVRVDTHVFTGYEIPPDYDSLLAKLVVWAADRQGAISRMRRALAEFRVSGPRLRTTRGFLADVLGQPRFVTATHDTSLVERMLTA
ncbi:MAG TPA: acetyl-CoA carboxylase biotin carboxylase subunit [Pseudonocardiaceae bacterium]|nr:acetyl-CoA carboxylase biotin carboxylase subunit [Pseudonocardiaceae bacterium]